MTFFSLKPSASCLKKAVLASGLLLISAQGHGAPGSDGPFLGLSGHWSGAGTVTLTNGATERIRCKAAYAVSSTGKSVQQTLRCASGADIVANVAGAGFMARLDVRTQGERQSVTIRPQGGTDVTAVSIALRKG